LRSLSEGDDRRVFKGGLDEASWVELALNQNAWWVGSWNITVRTGGRWEQLLIFCVAGLIMC
jgi:hypothetical protein